MTPGKKQPAREAFTLLAAMPEGYASLFESLKNQVRTAQIRAALAANSELVQLYWAIGREIGLKMEHDGWGAKVVDRLAVDLRGEFPEMTGFSPRNLRYMRSFAKAWPEELMLQQLVAKLPWGHNIVLLEKLANEVERRWYLHKALSNGWSRNVLVHQIESRLRERQGAAATNFDQALPPAQSDLARQLIKDPYVFDFLSLASDARERDLERGLVEHIRKFLLELGVGFAFLGSQYHLEVGATDFYIDMLFYHVKLRCYVVIDLKMGSFKPEYAGKMNFYLAAVDDLLRHPDDQPSIGLILCRDRNRTIVEYTLRDSAKPIGIATYKLLEDLPLQLRDSLPSPHRIATELSEPDAEAGDPE